LVRAQLRSTRARLTITISDDLHAEAEAEAARTGRTLSEVLHGRVPRNDLETRGSQAYGISRAADTAAEDPLPGADLDSNAALRDYFDDIGEKC
jgi:hypothetical protein